MLSLCMNDCTKLRGRLGSQSTDTLHLGNIRTFLITWFLARGSVAGVVDLLQRFDMNLLSHAPFIWRDD